MVRLGTPQFDFIVIGAQKAGTTSLWRYMEDHPKLTMPAYKEATFFSEPQYPAELRAYMRALFKDAPRGTKLGKVTPPYMTGVPGAPVPVIAQRIHETVPQVRLVALLRDPVDRAYSAHRMLVRRGVETRSFAEAIAAVLEPAEIERARREPADERSYVSAGEYGRTLSAYLELFPREQMHIELSADLERSPLDVVQRIVRFIGVEPHVPKEIGRRFHPSGRSRVSAEAEADLKQYFERSVWPKMRYPDQERHSFDQWFSFWNVVPEESEPEGPDPETAQRLREHFAEDARKLEAATGLRVPWATVG